MGWSKENIEYWLKREPDKTEKIRKITPIRLPFGLYTELGWNEKWKKSDLYKKFWVTRKGIIGTAKPRLRTIYFRVFREIRWFAKDRTFIVIKRDFIGRKKVEMIYRFRRGDMVKFGQYKPTIRTQSNTSTGWLYIERSRYDWPLNDYVLEGQRLQILKVRDFFVGCIIHQEEDEIHNLPHWSIDWDELDCEPFIHGGGDAHRYGEKVSSRVVEGLK